MFASFRKTKYPFHLAQRQDVIFVHIPKTGGTSIRHSLPFNLVKGQSHPKHLMCYQIVKLIGEENWGRAFTFAFVRNPWDRLFSHWRFKMRKIESSLATTPSIDAFKLWYFQELVPNLKQGESHLSKLFAPQVDWMCKDGEVLVDFVGRFEHLEQDYMALCKQIGYRVAPPLKHRNQSLPILDYRDFYDNELRTVVGQHYRGDVERFGYGFG